MPVWADFKDIPYINCIVKEGLRWHPVYVKRSVAVGTWKLTRVTDCLWECRIALPKMIGMKACSFRRMQLW